MSGSTAIWEKLADPIDEKRIGWRQDGKPTERNGSFTARFVAYIDAQTVADRLDFVVPGEWDTTLELLPVVEPTDGSEATIAVKCRIQILGVIREDIGEGRSYKAAATDAFKRAAARFRIGHELYAFKPNWVRVDGDGRYAKPLEDPGTAYARRYNGAVTGAASLPEPIGENTESIRPSKTQPFVSPDDDPAEPLVPRNIDGDPTCPTCGGKMWDNRLSKRNPKAPDFKCRDKSCDGVVWPKRPSKGNDARNGRSTTEGPYEGPPPALVDGLDLEPVTKYEPLEDDDLPF